MKLDTSYEAVIGLEVHAQMQTASKVFCGCPTKFGDEPNTNVCPICTGMPGVLPVLNRNVVEFALRMGLATHCSIAHRSVFARKNYFYPDLPKGYQITQYEEPICTNGSVEIDLENGTHKRIRIMRVHMEEDAGKSIHDADVGTQIDFNRCGVPLIEIVSEPDIRSPHEARVYLYKVRQIAMYLGICDGNMEEGSFRCDANVSVRKKGAANFGTKTEVKNLNSFRNAEHALEFEINRQIQILEGGGTVVSETLQWDANQNAALPMRSKEEVHDYRYFPDPDLVPILVDERWTDEVSRTLPEHPTARRDRYIKEYGLPKYDADVLTAEKGYADYFESVLKELRANSQEQIKQASNWVMTDVLRIVGERQIGIKEFPISPYNLARLIALILEGTISSRTAKNVFEEMLRSNGDPASIVEKKDWVQISDKLTIEKVVDGVVARNKPQVEKYRAGDEKVLGFLVGEVMKATKGKANPGVVNAVLKRKLGGVRK